MDKLKRWLPLTDKGLAGLMKSMLASILMYIAYLAPMMLLMYFVQAYLAPNELPSAIWFCVAILIAALVMYLFFRYAYNTTYKETYEESANLRLETANVLRGFPMSYFTKHDTTDLSQVIMKDITDIEHALSHSLPQMLGFVGYFFVISVLLLLTDWRLALCVLLPIALSILLFTLSARRQDKRSDEYHQILRQHSAKVQDAIELQQEIRSYGLSAEITQDITDFESSMEKVHLRAEMGQAIPLALSQGINILSLGLTILGGTILLQHGETTILFLVGFFLAAVKLNDGIAGLFGNASEILFIGPRLRRIQNLRQTKSQEGESVNIHSYDITFNHVNFHYNPDRQILKKVHFIAKQGDVTAIVGPSGSGKTTLLRLIARLYDYTDGSLQIGGKEVKNIAPDSLYPYISVVFQDVTLFNTSILENIRIGNLNATDEQVYEVARLAGCEAFIKELPDAYETTIGENGANLSGGERQRISIARALLKDTPIVVLDEISSALDLENEMKIQEGLLALIEGKTVVVISHRMRSIENADKIVVMHEGTVEAIGTHDDLLQVSPTYQKLVEHSQSAEEFSY